MDRELEYKTRELIRDRMTLLVRIAKTPDTLISELERIKKLDIGLKRYEITHLTNYPHSSYGECIGIKIWMNSIAVYQNYDMNYEL